MDQDMLTPETPTSADYARRATAYATLAAETLLTGDVETARNYATAYDSHNTMARLARREEATANAAQIASYADLKEARQNR